ncbi:MAG: hypothetical protein A3B38_01330 [Candidatus Levybacteria bacterium RIFCSPLOWO2_01_FULL_36_13]|nr:MAG: hypothetical protein A2684_02565 [Candidatus Levybacteria bacterium RIFCSPHIGHO2_01_FULL_36_15b]OGH35520.1 MAG: hypothetical protein A3B38_01330 [Candidatus Levybacteria bacterium RIFCSPLOWO2_01_FULL_36_13]
MSKVKVFLGFILLLFGVIVFYLVFLNFQNDTFGKIVSPLPNTYFWFSGVQNIIKDSAKAPFVSATSAFAYDLTDEKILFDKNSSQKLPIASLTKIMTAVVALENPKKDDKYLVKSEDLVGENSMGLEAGEVLSLKELLYGLILRSGNDTAETLASNYPGGRIAFIAAMNKKAKDLGLKDTNFTNPTGLEGDGNQHSTAKDLVVITKYALDKFQSFRDVSKTFIYTIQASPTHKAYIMENETNLISSYPGVKGVKIGFTNEAGYCLVTYLEYGEHQIISVLLNSSDRRQEMKNLLDFSLKSLGVIPPQHI